MSIDTIPGSGELWRPPERQLDESGRLLLLEQGSELAPLVDFVQALRTDLEQGWGEDTMHPTPPDQEGDKPLSFAQCGVSSVVAAPRLQRAFPEEEFVIAIGGVPQIDQRPLEWPIPWHAWVLKRTADPCRSVHVCVTSDQGKGGKLPKVIVATDETLLRNGVAMIPSKIFPDVESYLRHGDGSNNLRQRAARLGQRLPGYQPADEAEFSYHARAAIEAAVALSQTVSSTGEADQSFIAEVARMTQSLSDRGIDLLEELFRGARRVTTPIPSVTSVLIGELPDPFPGQLDPRANYADIHCDESRVLGLVHMGLGGREREISKWEKVEQEQFEIAFGKRIMTRSGIIVEEVKALSMRSAFVKGPRSVGWERARNSEVRYIVFHPSGVTQ